MGLRRVSSRVACAITATSIACAVPASDEPVAPASAPAPAPAVDQAPSSAALAPASATPMVTVEIPEFAMVPICEGPDCPEPLPIEHCLLQLPEPLRFDVVNVTLDPQSEAILDAVVATLASNPRLRLEIQGHSNSYPEAALSVMVSKWKHLLNAVERDLIEAGVDERRLETKFYGEVRPIDSDRTPEGRARNRRIEFRDMDCEG